MKKIKIIFVLTVGMFVLSSTSTSAQVSVGVSITASIPPPVLPVYAQPPCPFDGYLWVPGYWAWGEDGYFWVPGIWVRPPQYGYLWTPAWWGFAGGVYGFHAGYWGPHVGYYGGINYGYGYTGSGFYGGRWEGHSFRYNTAVVNVNTTIVHNTYVDRTVVVNNTRENSRTSFNGGSGGVSARPTAQEETAMRERHVQATSQQVSHMQQARQDRNQFASVNHGQPVTAAMSKPGGTRYDPHGNVPVVHHVNNQPAVTHNPGTVNHPAPQHPQAANNHPAPQHQQAPNNHPVPQQHQQAYHPAPQQQHMNHQQPHNPAPQHAAQPQHGEPAHPKEH